MRLVAHAARRVEADRRGPEERAQVGGEVARRRGRRRRPRAPGGPANSSESSSAATTNGRSDADTKAACGDAGGLAGEPLELGALVRFVE